MLGAALSSKGQVTIPLLIRKSMGLKPGDRVAFISEGDRALVVPLHGGDFLKSAGALRAHAGGRASDAGAALRAAAARDDRSRRR